MVPYTHLPPRPLADGELHAVAVQGQVQRCYGDVLRRMTDAHVSVVTVSQQSPGRLGYRGSRPSVSVHQSLHREQVVEQILQREQFSCEFMLQMLHILHFSQVFFFIYRNRFVILIS